MEPVTKELPCSACGKPAVVRIRPGPGPHRWQCPDCRKIQETPPPVADAAAVR